ncbi:hypothetical protein NQ318_006318 [Aromia moschata]|uniref:DUF4817 domain-containing protein n=1 Tax=Aromia moschata TaxID=1265417 RepID=A0AAV8XCL5_9CUCU|nr:hypothetical protein NQ318_006318 [Aromia moschata]
MVIGRELNAKLFACFEKRILTCTTKSSKIEAQYREMGHVRKVPSKRQAVVDDDTKLNLLLALEENPITPARQLARDSNLNHKTVLKILKYEKKRPYKMQAVHELLEDDPDLDDGSRRSRKGSAYCLADAGPGTGAGSVSGVAKLHFLNYATVGNRGRSLDIFLLWKPRLIDCKLESISLLVLQLQLWDERSYSSLSTYREQPSGKIKEHIPIDNRQRMSFVHHRAPAHFSHIVTDYLNRTYGNPTRWVEQNGPVKWPPRSSDLTPLWSWMKERRTEESLRGICSNDQGSSWCYNLKRKHGFVVANVAFNKTDTTLNS